MADCEQDPAFAGFLLFLDRFRCIGRKSLKNNIKIAFIEL